MPNAEQFAAKAAELLKKDAVIITAVEIKHGIVNRIQVYFWSDGQAVMDIINKDDLVQNWPDSGVYTLNTNAKNCDSAFRKVEMFEGEEDMYFRVDGTHEESDDFGMLPSVLFLETVEAICNLK
jgi:hypothetical protein